LDLFRSGGIQGFFDRTRNWADLETMEQAGTLDIDRVRSTLMEYLGADDERLASL